MGPCRMLITNDDGIASPGLHALAMIAVDRGMDVVVAAPATEASGSSAAMTAVERGGQVAITDRPLDGLVGVAAYAASATPAFITMLALQGVFGPVPQVVISGINRGANAGHAVLHSGTVGAAFTAAANGCHAIAVSLHVIEPPTAVPEALELELELGGGEPPDVPEQELVAGVIADAAAVFAAFHDADRCWPTAAALAMEVVAWLPDQPAGVVLNLNVPDLPPEQVRGLRRASLARFGQAQISIAEAGRGFVRLAMSEAGGLLEPGTDLALLNDGYAVLTPIRAVTEATEVSLPI